MTMEELTQRESARRELNKAIRTGLLKRPERCQNCGTIPDDGNIHGHHEDYSKPLLIEWLCVPCHGAKRRGAAPSVPISVRLPKPMLLRLNVHAARHGQKRLDLIITAIGNFLRESRA